MSDPGKPDPLDALLSAAAECGVEVPSGLLEGIVRLESESLGQESTAAVIQSQIRTLIENAAKGT